jgi:hypothetical protein
MASCKIVGVATRVLTKVFTTISKIPIGIQRLAAATIAASDFYIVLLNTCTTHKQPECIYEQQGNDDVESLFLPQQQQKTLRSSDATSSVDDVVVV